MKRPSAGFTLAEVLAALVVLEVGILGVTGLVILSARILGEAVRTGRWVELAAETADSLAVAGFSGPGARSVSGEIVEWRSVDGADDGPVGVTLSVTDSTGADLLRFRAILPRSESGGGPGTGGG